MWAKAERCIAGSHVDIWKKTTPGTNKSMYKGLESGVHLEH